MADRSHFGENICDLICIGFGPTALALAIAFLDKKNAYIVREVLWLIMVILKPEIRQRERCRP